MDKFSEKARLSDRILFALELALEQHDLDSADILVRALEHAMTRKTGGGEFVERREYPETVEKIMQQFRSLQQARRS